MSGGGHDHEWGKGKRHCERYPPGGCNRRGHVSLCLSASALVAQHQNSPRPSSPPHSLCAAPAEPAVHASAIAGPAKSGYGAPQYQNRTPQQYPNRAPQQYQQYRPPAGTQMQRPGQNMYAPQPGARGVYPIETTTRQSTVGSRIRAPPSRLTRLLAILARGLTRIAMFRCSSSSRCCAVIRVFANCRRANSSV